MKNICQMSYKEYVQTPKFFHATPKIKNFNQFNTSEVWCDLLPTNYDYYGEGASKGEVEEGEQGRQMLIAYDWQKPFVTYYDAIDYYPEFQHLTPKDILANELKYKELGGEVSRKSFDWMRSQGYDILVDNEGWCLLYPKRVQILSHNVWEDFGNPNQINENDREIYNKIKRSCLPTKVPPFRATASALRKKTYRPGIKSL